jgi:hypothetical protein
MKKFTSVFALLFLIAFVNSNISAQNFSAGAGVAYGTDISSFGFSVNGVYSFNEKMSIAPSYIYFPEVDFVTWSVINVDMHYNFMTENGMDVYGIAGMGITMISFDYDWEGLDDLSSTSTNFGVNLGGGVSKSISKSLNIFGELKYTLSSGSFLSLNAGVLYNF